MLRDCTKRQREPYLEIKTFMLKNNISQSDIAGAIGKQLSDINKRLNGTGSDFTLTEARILARKFAIPNKFFFEPSVLKNEQMM